MTHASTNISSEMHPAFVPDEDLRTQEVGLEPGTEFQDGSYHHALGHAAVNNEEQRVTGLMSSDTDTPPRIDPYRTQLYMARRMIKAALKSSNPTYVNSLLVPTDMPEWLRRATGTEEDPAILAANLADKKQVSDETALNVLQRHNYYHAQNQRFYEREELPEIRERYKTSITRAVDEGWIPASLLTKLGCLDEIPVFLDDGFEVQRVGADAFTNGTEITMGPAIEGHPLNYTHEANHVLAGIDILPEKTKDNWRNSSGLSRIFRLRPLFRSTAMPNTGGSALNEAMTERMATALISGDIDTPPKVDDMQHYVREQWLLNTLCSKGVKPVDIRLFVAAYFEDGVERDKLGSDSAAAQLVDALDEAFPRIDVMFRLSSLTNKLNPTARLVKKLKKEGQRGPVPEMAGHLYRRTKRPIGSY